MSHPYLDNGGPIAFAHRGGTSHAPENTMPAFEDAVSLGYRYLETDVQVTSDGVLLAFHDNDLKRTCGVDRTVSDTPWEEISRLRVDGREPIPLLEDLLASFPTVRFNIDCKTDAAVGPLVHCLKSRECLDRVCLGSFSDRRLAVLRRELGAGLCSSMGPRAVARLLGGSLRLPVGRPIGLAAQIPISQGPIPVCTPRLVEHAHNLGVQVHVWTVDEPDVMRSLLDMGVDGVMSDDTRALRDVFVDRGLWN